MKSIFTLLTMLVMVVGMTVSAHAALVDNLDGTVTQTRNDGSTLMWLKDANYANTSGYFAVDEFGTMIWNDARIWADTLSYAGYDDWRLPDTLPVNGVSYDYNWSYDGSTDVGYNISAPGSAYPGSTGSEMAYMYYTELGNLGQCDTGGVCPQPGSGLTNTGPFDNLQAVQYWSGTEYAPNPEDAWFFRFEIGSQYSVNKYPGGNYAWAVRIVPEPISSILFVTGGATLGFRRFWKKRKST